MRCKWLCVLMLAGCLSDENDGPCARVSETYHLAGEVSLTESAKSAASEGAAQGPIVLEAFESSSVTFCKGDRIGVANPGQRIGELVMSGPGTFELDLHVDVYKAHIPGLQLTGFLDANDDGFCTPGELQVNVGIGRHDQDDIKLEFKAGQSCLYRL